MLGKYNKTMIAGVLLSILSRGIANAEEVKVITLFLSENIKIQASEEFISKLEDVNAGKVDSIKINSNLEMEIINILSGELKNKTSRSIKCRADQL